MFSLLNELGLTEFKCFEQAVTKKRAITEKKMKCAGFPNFADRITFEVHHIGMSFAVVVFHGKRRILSKKMDEFPKWIKSLQSSRFNVFCYGKDKSLIHEDTGKLDEKKVKIYPKEIELQEAVNKRKLKESTKKLTIFKKIHNKLIDIFGKRAIELGMFVIFCGFLFLSFKTIYGNYAAKRKLRWKTG